MLKRELGLLVNLPGSALAERGPLGATGRNGVCPGPAPQPLPERASRRARHDRTAPDATGNRDQQRDRHVGAPGCPDFDVAAADYDVIGVDGDAWLGDHRQAPAPDFRVQLDGTVCDDRICEIELAAAACHSYLDPPRHHPTADPAHVAAAAFQPHHILRRDRLADLKRRDRLLSDGQIAGQGCEFTVGTGRERDLKALVKLLGGEPAVAGSDPEYLDHAVAVLMRRPELADLRVRVGPRRNVARHGHTLSLVATTGTGLIASPAGSRPSAP